jgi:hypothetical protein
MEAARLNREIKLEVLEWVANLKDGGVINLLNDLRMMQGTTHNGPFSDEEMVQRALRSEEDIKAGRVISLEDLRQEILDED